MENTAPLITESQAKPPDPLNSKPWRTSFGISLPGVPPLFSSGEMLIRPSSDGIFTAGLHTGLTSSGQNARLVQSWAHTRPGQSPPWEFLSPAGKMVSACQPGAAWGHFHGFTGDAGLGKDRLSLAKSGAG